MCDLKFQYNIIVHICCVYIVFNFWLLYRLMTYYYHIYRLHVSFMNSIYEIKQRKVVYLYIISFVISGTFIVLAVFWRNDESLRVILISFNIFDVIFTLYLTKLFLWRMDLIMRLGNPEQFAKIYHKIRVLYILCIISNIVFIMVFLIKTSDYIMLYHTIGIDLIINNISVMFQFANASKTYGICCNICIVIIPKVKIPTNDEFEISNTGPVVQSKVRNKLNLEKHQIPSDTPFTYDTRDTPNSEDPINMDDDAFVEISNNPIKKDGTDIHDQQRRIMSPINGIYIYSIRFHINVLPNINTQMYIY